jgi:hypothetical protein
MVDAVRYLFAFAAVLRLATVVRCARCDALSLSIVAFVGRIRTTQPRAFLLSDVATAVGIFLCCVTEARFIDISIVILRR